MQEIKCDYCGKQGAHQYYGPSLRVKKLRIILCLNCERVHFIICKRCLHDINDLFPHTQQTCDENVSSNVLNA